MEYYKTIIKYKEKRYYIWMSGEVDYFLTENSRLVSFGKEKDLEAYIQERGIILIDEDTQITIPKKRYIRKLLKTDTGEFCCEFLSLWNLAIDLQNSFPEKKTLLNDCNVLYDKLFWGNNLPTITPKEKKYIPLFTKEEKKQLRRLMEEIYGVIDKRFGNE